MVVGIPCMANTDTKINKAYMNRITTLGDRPHRRLWPRRSTGARDRLRFPRLTRRPGVHLLDRQVRDAQSVRMAPRIILSCPTSVWPRDSDRHSTARNQRNAQRAALGFRRDIRPAVSEAKEAYLSSEPAAARDPYRMSISLSTAAASSNARRSAPSGSGTGFADQRRS